MADDPPIQDTPEPKREPLRITVGPKSDMTPGPPGTSEPGPDPVTALNATQRSTQDMLAERHPEKLPHVTDDDAGNALFEKLLPGQKFVDAAGKTFTKPWTVEDDSDFEKVPEGATFVDREGKKYKKPAYQPISATAQMLYEMAQTPDAKEQALKTVYGDKVKKYSSGEMYIDDDGTPRKPGARSVGTFAATSAAELGPAAGMAIGSLGGPGGTVAGAAMGRQFNNTILSLFGIHQSAGEQVSSSAWEGAGAAIGEPIGKVAGAIPGAVKGGAKYVSETGGKLYKRAGDIAGGALGDTLESLGITPSFARGILGLTTEKAKQASDIASRLQPSAEGKYKSPLSPKVMFPESPFLGKLQEFDVIFRKQNVFEEATRDFADQETKRILENDALGIRLDEPPSRATKKVSAHQAGRLVLDAAQQEMAQHDAALENVLRQHTATVNAGTAAQTNWLQAAQAAQRADMEAAERLIRAQADQMRREVDAVMTLAGHNEDPSAAHRMVAAQIDAFDTGVRGRARQMYNAARAVTEGAPFPNTTRLAAHAEAFLRSMPESLRGRYPSEIADLARLVDRDVEIPGVRNAAVVPEGEPQQSLDWAGLHHLRSWLRHGIDYQDMTPDMRQGALKHFEREINAVLHDPNAPPQLRQAADLLDQADAFYRTNIPFLNDEIVRFVMKGLESGTGVDAKVVAKTLFDPDRTAALRRARSIIGENGWRQVEAAHVQNMLKQSETLVPGQYDFTRFASQVEDQIRSGIIDTAYSPLMANQLRALATRMGQFRGSIPIPAAQNDTLAMLMRRGAAAKEAIDRAADTDPVQALREEMTRLQMDHAQVTANLKQSPLGFLYRDNMSQMAATAAERILRNPDLLRLAATKFGRESPEFKALQQVAVQRYFQRPFERLGMMRTELADAQKGMTEEMQALLFPGVTRDMMVQFSKDMEFLFSGGATDVAGSMAGGSRVLNPGNYIPFPKGDPVSRFILGLPGVNFVARLTLGKAFALTMDAVSHPNFAHWLAENLKGSPEQREIARKVVQNRLKVSGVVGAAAGQKELGGPADQYTQQPEMAQ